MSFVFTSCAVSLQDCDITLDRQEIVNLVIVDLNINLSDHDAPPLNEMMIENRFIQFSHRMDSLMEIYNFYIKMAVTKIHEVAKYQDIHNNRSLSCLCFRYRLQSPHTSRNPSHDED